MSDWSDESAALFDAERGAAGPSADVRARIRAGVAARVAGVAAAATVTGTTGQAAAGAPTVAAKGAASMLAAKLAVPVLFASVAAAGVGVTAVSMRAPRETRASVAEPRASAPHAAALLPAVPLAPTAPSARAAEEAPRAAIDLPSPATAGAATPHANARLASDPLATEIARVGAIESSLRRGDPASALALSDAYMGDYPNGAFRDEASGDGVLAACALARAHAEDAAARFVRTHPRSLLTERVRAACNVEDSITEGATSGQ